MPCRPTPASSRSPLVRPYTIPHDTSAFTAADKARAVKGVAESGRSTQETHRKAIDFETLSLDKTIGVLHEQMKRADSAAERGAIADKVLKVQLESSGRVMAHSDNSTSVFQYVVVFGVAALGLGAAAFSLLGSSKK